jgi:hypothetical protein
MLLAALMLLVHQMPHRSPMRVHSGVMGDIGCPPV